MVTRKTKLIDIIKEMKKELGELPEEASVIKKTLKKPKKVKSSGRKN